MLIYTHIVPAAFPCSAFTRVEPGASTGHRAVLLSPILETSQDSAGDASLVNVTGYSSSIRPANSIASIDRSDNNTVNRLNTSSYTSNDDREVHSISVSEHSTTLQDQEEPETTMSEEEESNNWLEFPLSPRELRQLMKAMRPYVTTYPGCSMDAKSSAPTVVIGSVLKFQDLQVFSYPGYCVRHCPFPFGPRTPVKFVYARCGILRMSLSLSLSFFLSFFPFLSLSLSFSLFLSSSLFLSLSCALPPSLSFSFSLSLFALSFCLSLFLFLFLTLSLSLARFLSPCFSFLFSVCPWRFGL